MVQSPVSTFRLYLTSLEMYAIHQKLAYFLITKSTLSQFLSNQNRSVIILLAHHCIKVFIRGELVSRSQNEVSILS